MLLLKYNFTDIDSDYLLIIYWFAADKAVLTVELPSESAPKPLKNVNLHSPNENAAAIAPTAAAAATVVEPVPALEVHSPMYVYYISWTHTNIGYVQHLREMWKWPAPV